jgi:uncharacterized protein
MQNLFWNADQNRLRAGWRLGIQFMLFFGVLVASTVIAKAVSSDYKAGLLESLLYLAGVPATVWLMARFIDHRPFADYGFHFNRAWAADFAIGLLLGALMLSGVFFTEERAGWVVVTGASVSGLSVGVASAVSVRLLSWIATGINEELVFRGYQIRNLAEGFMGPKRDARAALLTAALTSSAYFGLAHLLNANATVLSTVIIMVAGLMLSLPVLLTGELALSIGFHITWNFFEGTVYGFAVSGSVPATHLFTIGQRGPVYWTGGAFGPEGGLVCLLWLLIDFALLAAWLRFRGCRFHRDEIVATGLRVPASPAPIDSLP